MKVVAINGSPRKQGNTELLLRKVLEPIAAKGIETELMQVGNRPVRGCLACMKCFERKNNQCCQTDDLFNECFEKLVEADAMVLGSPSYFAGMTAAMKAVIERAGFVAIANGGLFARKIGAAVGAHRRGGAVNVMDSINHMFLMSRMIVPGSIYWNFGVGMEKGDVTKDEEALANMSDLGETIAWLVTRLHGHA